MEKIFTVGHFKTGTSSYSLAIKKLGLIDLHFPVDYAEELSKTGKAPFYTTREWDSISNLHELEYGQCEETYPDCKFILTTRDVDKWLKSIKYFMCRPMKPPINERFEIVFGVSRKKENFDEERFRKIFLEHDKEVRKYFSHPKYIDRFLILDLDSNENLMKKLCNFLGKNFSTELTYPKTNVTPYSYYEKINFGLVQ